MAADVVNMRGFLLEQANKCRNAAQMLSLLSEKDGDAAFVGAQELTNRAEDVELLISRLPKAA